MFSPFKCRLKGIVNAVILIFNICAEWERIAAEMNPLFPSRIRQKILTGKNLLKIHQDWHYSYVSSVFFQTIRYLRPTAFLIQQQVILKN